MELKAPTAVQSSCLCGAVKISAKAPMHIDHCHCDNCTRTSGSPVVPWATVPFEGYEVSGDAEVYQSSSHGKRVFCKKCGSTLAFVPEGDEEVDLAVGCLENRAEQSMRPAFHIFTYNRISWADSIDDDLPTREDALKQEMKVQSTRGSSDPILRDEMITGHCFCKNIELTLQGPPITSLWCHCKSCQASSGGIAIVWACWASEITHGADSDEKRTPYRHGAEFERRFCKTCGSMVSGHTPASPEKTWVPIPILDEPGRVAPMFHQFTSSALPWLRVRDRRHKFAGSADYSCSLDAVVA